MYPDIKVYHPYRSHRFFIPLLSCEGIFLFVISGIVISSKHIANFILLFSIALLCSFLTKFLYDSVRVAVCFESDGLRLINEKGVIDRYIPWKNLSYGYYASNYKGHLFCVMSPNALSPKQVKHLVNEGANSLKVYVDNAVVLHIDPLQNAAQLKAILLDKIHFMTEKP